jgi:glutaredoxin
MEIKIYTNQGCGYCKKAKELCERAGLEYTEYRLNKDITYEEFKELFPTQTSFPQMVVDGQSIGGLTDAVRYFVENKMITKSTK